MLNMLLFFFLNMLLLKCVIRIAPYTLHVPAAQAPSHTEVPPARSFLLAHTEQVLCIYIHLKNTHTGSCPAL